MFPTSPKCPVCGSGDVRRITSRECYAPGTSVFSSRPNSEIVAYRCNCGMSFTVNVDLPPVKTLKKTAGKSTA